MKCQRQAELILRYAHRAELYPAAYSIKYPTRLLSTKPEPNQHEDDERSDADSRQNEHSTDGTNEEEGAMTRRMKEMSEEAMLGGKSAMKNMQEAGFSEELKQRLEERIATTSFKNENSQAFSIANMPRSAGRGTHDNAAAAPWTGTEHIHDTALRMLDDSSKPMRVPFKPPTPSPVNLQRSARNPRSSGQRLAQARDRKHTYELSQDSHISDAEREAYRRELQDRFTPGARAFPMSLHGLNSLANERIEDAIAKGQFRNIPRGKGKHIERDHTALNPYLDTTEYLMNRIMQKQEVTPEWIQKQQELKLEIHRFRTQLRSDWKRHAARLISSQGGTLQMQIRRAQAYAVAEAKQNQSSQAPIQTGDKNVTGVEPRTQIDHEGRLSRVPPSPSPSSNDISQSQHTATSHVPLADTADTTADPADELLPNLPCLRDPQYFTIEKEYHDLKIKRLNEMVRSYNLLAPQVAQRPYLKLQRELDLCYAEVAPSLAEEVHRRATQRSHESNNVPAKGDASVLQQTLGLGQSVRVYDEDVSKGYGLKQLWRDLWGHRETT